MAILVIWLSNMRAGNNAIRFETVSVHMHNHRRILEIIKWHNYVTKNDELAQFTGLYTTSEIAHARDGSSCGIWTYRSFAVHRSCLIRRLSTLRGNGRCSSRIELETSL